MYAEENALSDLQTESHIDETVITLDKRCIRSNVKSWLNSRYCTGDLKGYRSKLASKGLTFDLNYLNDNFLNPYGGINNDTAFRYMGVIEMRMAEAYNKQGHSLTSVIGDMQFYDAYDLPASMLLSQYWYQQRLFKNKLRLKIGKQNASYDFAAVPSSFNYMGASHYLLPTIPIPAFPNPSLGVMGEFKPHRRISLKAGVYDGDSSAKKLCWKTTFDGHGGSVVITEAMLSHSLKSHPGSYVAGLWHHNGDLPEITYNATNRLFSGSMGFYGTFEQKLFNENKNDHQGLLLNAQYGWTQGDRRRISSYYGAGLQYTGLVPHRDNDIAGIGLAIARLNKRLKQIEGSTGETSLELFYQFRLTDWLMIQPGMQFIFNPSGRFRNTMVMGIRTIIRL